MQPFDGDLADYSRFVLSGGEAPQKRKPDPAPPPLAKPKREPMPARRELAALEEKIKRFQDLLRRVDDALAQASARGGDAVKFADLADKRAELERALTTSEEAWLTLSEEAEAR